MTYDGDDRECLDELALLACNDCLRMLSMGNKTIRHIFEEFCLVLQRASQIPQFRNIFVDGSEVSAPRAYC
jgi:hypothetical protein